MSVNEQDKPTLPKGAVDRIAEHYCHARRKHPHFADELFNLDGFDSFESRASAAHNYLSSMRADLETETRGSERGNRKPKVHAETVLDCEVAEAMFEDARGDKPRAVEECYDAIAVLLRMIDVLEGRQKLGPSTRGEGGE